MDFNIFAFVLTRWLSFVGLKSLYRLREIHAFDKAIYKTETYMKIFWNETITIWMALELYTWMICFSIIKSGIFDIWTLFQKFFIKSVQFNNL